MIKTKKKGGMKETHINIRKATYDKSTANIVINRERLKDFPLRLEQDKGAHFHLSYSIQYWKS